MAKTEKGGVIVEFYFSFLVLNYCSLNFKRDKLYSTETQGVWRRWLLSERIYLILGLTRRFWKARGLQFNENSSSKFRKFHVPNEMVHSGCTDPTQATARLVIVLVSRMQKSGTRNNNFVKRKGTFGPTDLQRWSQIFRSDRTEMACSIWFLTKISGILGRMESAPSLSSKKNEYPGENAKRWYRKSNSWLTNFQICQLEKLNKLHTGPSKTTSQ